MLRELMVFASLCLSTHLVQSNNQDDRVLLSDVKALTFYKGQYTRARRVPPILQLNCIGGSAKCAYLTDVVQCYNKGSDGHDIQWSCTTVLPEKYELGRLNVLCEGYDSPNDPYILVGSCGLEYHLELAGSSLSPAVVIVIVLLSLVCVVSVIVAAATSSGSGSNSNNLLPYHSTHHSTHHSTSSYGTTTHTSTGFGGTTTR